MFIERPHVRLDGAYVLKTTYWQAGALGLTRAQRVHEISYYRYLEFQTNGVVHYALVNSTPPLSKPLKDKAVHQGIYRAYDAGLVVRVDVGYMIANLKLLYCETRKGSHDRLIFSDFLGQSDIDPAPVRFPVPENLFQFCPHGESKATLSSGQQSYLEPFTAFPQSFLTPTAREARENREEKSRRGPTDNEWEFKVSGVVPTGVRSAKPAQETKKPAQDGEVKARVSASDTSTTKDLPKPIETKHLLESSQQRKHEREKTQTGKDSTDKRKKNKKGKGPKAKPK